jgi:beta-lactamase superfamily II metal-dependent hydrolase
MPLKYLAKTPTFKVALREGREPRSELITTLLWGDPVHVPPDEGEAVEEVDGWVRVRARGKRPGWLRRDQLSDESLLEIYVIDVGQGDGVLLKTPDDRWHLVDAGVENERQMTKKGAPNFVRWKFLEDLQAKEVAFENVILTHGDADHYGGLIDLFEGRLPFHPRFDVGVRNFFHNGIGRFRARPALGRTRRGTVAAFPFDRRLSREDDFIVDLLDGPETFANPPRELQAGFGRLAAFVAERPDNVARLSYLDKHLPGYGPGDSAVTIRVLGPILERFGRSSTGLRVLGSDAVTLNGHSVVLRLDYRQASILLTGDLNRQSQGLLLSYHSPEVFAVDVAKACHHGAEEVHLDFVRAMQARATVISSGDNETYSHPRPALMGASARYGREARGRTAREILPPLVYSTELARAVKLGFALSVRERAQAGAEPRAGLFDDTEIELPNDRWPFRRLKYTPVSADLVYGLVNVRTDGEHVLCATLEETGKDFDLKVFRAGVDV